MAHCNECGAYVPDEHVSVDPEEWVCTDCRLSI